MKLGRIVTWLMRALMLLYAVWWFWRDYSRYASTASSPDPVGYLGSFQPLPLPFLLTLVAVALGVWIAPLIDRYLMSLSQRMVRPLIALLIGLGTISAGLTVALLFQNNLWGVLAMGLAMLFAVQAARLARVGPEATSYPDDALTGRKK